MENNFEEWIGSKEAEAIVKRVHSSKEYPYKCSHCRFKWEQSNNVQVIICPRCESHKIRVEDE